MVLTCTMCRSLWPDQMGLGALRTMLLWMSHSSPCNECIL